MVNRTELVARVAEQTGARKKEVEKVIAATLDVIESAVTAGEKVQVVGFGTFEARKRAERMGRNPRTGKSMKIAASKVPAFKAGKAFKGKVAAV